LNTYCILNKLPYSNTNRSLLTLLLSILSKKKITENFKDLNLNSKIFSIENSSKSYSFYETLSFLKTYSYSLYLEETDNIPTNKNKMFLDSFFIFDFYFKFFEEFSKKDFCFDSFMLCNFYKKSMSISNSFLKEFRDNNNLTSKNFTYIYFKKNQDSSIELTDLFFIGVFFNILSDKISFNKDFLLTFKKDFIEQFIKKDLNINAKELAFYNNDEDFFYNKMNNSFVHYFSTSKFINKFIYSPFSFKKDVGNEFLKALEKFKIKENYKVLKAPDNTLPLNKFSEKIFLKSISNLKPYSKYIEKAFSEYLHLCMPYSYEFDFNNDLYDYNHTQTDINLSFMKINNKFISYIYSFIIKNDIKPSKSLKSRYLNLVKKSLSFYNEDLIKLMNYNSNEPIYFDHLFSTKIKRSSLFLSIILDYKNKNKLINRYFFKAFSDTKGEIKKEILIQNFFEHFLTAFENTNNDKFKNKKFLKKLKYFQEIKTNQKYYIL